MNGYQATRPLSRMQSPRPLLSIVVPVYNERAVLPECVARISAVIAAMQVRCEIVFVDDGSVDGSAEWLKNSTALGCKIRTVILSRNFGKEAAMTAGIDLARGDAVIVLDADLQDPPELIPAMVQRWQEGFHVVAMKRRSRVGENWFKCLSARLFYRILNRISDSEIPENVGDFRLMSRYAVDALKRLPERNRYMKGLFAWIGMDTCVIEYDRAPRAAGESKWGILSLLQLALDGVTSFSITPLRIATLLGLVTASIGGGYGLWIVYKTLMFGDAVQGYPSMMAMMTFMGGIQLLVIGILGEYVGKTYLEAKARPTYLIKDIFPTHPMSPVMPHVPAARNKPVVEVFHAQQN